MKFPGAVKGRCIEINVIVNMGLVGMRTDKELILSLCPAHRRFITDTICFFRRNLPGQERLPDLKEQGREIRPGLSLQGIDFLPEETRREPCSDRRDRKIRLPTFPGSGHR